MKKERVYFISDVHLGIDLKGIESREDDLIEFLKKISSKASEIYIVGDLFDFWIEYKHAIRPCYFKILHQFKTMIEAGIKINYIAGNHDFALGSFLSNVIGFNIIPDDIATEIQGKKVYLRHGDGVIKRDWGYRLLRGLLRVEFFQKFYKIMHPNIGVPLASSFSGSSRHFNSSKFTKEREMEYLEAARGFLKKGHDILFMGHTHHPALYKVDGGVYCNTGEWMKKYSYAFLENGKLSLRLIDKTSSEEVEVDYQLK